MTRLVAYALAAALGTAAFTHLVTLDLPGRAAHALALRAYGGVDHAAGY